MNYDWAIIRWDASYIVNKTCAHTLKAYLYPVTILECVSASIGELHSTEKVHMYVAGDAELLIFEVMLL